MAYQLNQKQAHIRERFGSGDAEFCQEADL